MAFIENKEQYENIFVDELELSVRASNSLHRGGIHTLYQLIDLYNRGELLDIRNLGRNSFEEIEAKLYEVNDSGIDTNVQEDEAIEVYVVPEELEDISIAELKLNVRQFNCLKRGGVNTVGDLLRMKLTDIVELRGAGAETVAEIRRIISELHEKGVEYFEEVLPENEPIDENKLRTIDTETARKLRDEYDFRPLLLSEWYGVSRQRSYQMIENRSNKGNWLNRSFGETEKLLLDEMINEGKYFVETEDGQKAYFFNNKKDDCAIVFVSEDEIKCFFLSMLSEDNRNRILEKRMECLTEEELGVIARGKSVFVLRQEYFLPGNSVRFRYHADTRGMSPEEYCKFLTGLPITTGQATVNDEKILEFLHAHYVDGKLMIPSNNSTMWFRSFISRHGYSIDEIAKLYELDVDSESEITEYDVNTVEEDMRDYGEADSWINSLFAQNPLIGNKRLSETTREKLYNITKKYIDQILREPLVKAPLTAKMQITLMVITFAKEWDTSDESGFWRYITAQFGYRDDTGRLRGILCDYLLESMQKNHRWFVSTTNGYQYKATIVAHALSTKRSWMRLYDFLFDFYKNNMDWTYVEDDPIVYRMVEALKNKLIAGDEVNEDNLEISNNVYTFQEGIRKLVIYRTRYAVQLIAHMLHRIDDVVNHLENPPMLYVDELCDTWMEERIRGASNSRTRETAGRRRVVAVDYTRIRPVYSLNNETEVKISFPDIRLKKTEFNSLELLIYSGKAVIENRTLNFYGNELGKSLSGFDIDVDKCLRNGNGSLELRTVITCDDEVIYDSSDLLYREILCFLGEREVNISSCEKGGYSIFAPYATKIDFIGAEVSEISAANSFEAYYVRLDDGFVIRKDERVLAYDESSSTSNTGIRAVLPKARKGIAFIHNGKKYDVIHELGKIHIVVDKDYDFKKSRVLMNGKQISLSDYEKESVGNGLLFKIPLEVREDNTCEFEIVDLDNNRVATRAALIYRESFSWRFDKNIYYCGSDYENAYVKVFNGKKTYSEKIDSEDDFASVNADGGVYEIKIPKIYVRNGIGEAWELGKWYWIKEFDQSDKIYINAPDNCEVSLTVGDIDAVEDVKNTYSIGNAVYALSAYASEELIDISLKVMTSGDTYKYSLGKIASKERFMISPKFDFREGNLYWNRGNRFIGDNESEIKLILSGNNIEKSYFLNPEDTLVVKDIDIPLGEYDYRIIKESANLFSMDEEELAAGILIIGDKDALRFRNSIISITHITNEDDDQLQSVVIKGTYIENLEYQGIHYVDSEERECPVYTGTMFYMGQSGKHHAFSFEETHTDGGHSVYKVNPVKIVYINEHTISITNDDGDGIYYYRHFNREKMTNVYLVTDREPEEYNQNNYYLADLYLYQKEKIENV